MKPETALSAETIVGHAGECIRKALETWNAADLARVAGSQKLLEHAVDDLRRVTEALSRNPPQSTKELRPLVAALRRDVARMTRVVDTCSAFYRGLTARLGDRGVAYDACGCVPRVADAPLARGFEV
jgi:hypothetical protein